MNRNVYAYTCHSGTTVMVALFTNSFNDVEWLSVNAERFDVVFNSSNDLASIPTITQVSAPCLSVSLSLYLSQLFRNYRFFISILIVYRSNCTKAGRFWGLGGSVCRSSQVVISKLRRFGPKLDASGANACKMTSEA